MRGSEVVFISHASEDSDQARELEGLLEDCGYSSFLARSDLTAGAEWAARISEAIARARVFILLLSRYSNESGEVSSEAHLAKKHGCPGLAIRLGKVNPSKALEYYLAERQWLDAFPGGITAHQEEIVAAVSDLLQADRPGIPWNRKMHAWGSGWRKAAGWIFALGVLGVIAAGVTDFFGGQQAAMNPAGMIAPAAAGGGQISAAQAVEQARALLFSGQTERAISLLTSAAQSLPESAEPQVLLCVADMQRQDPASAIRHASQAIQLDARHYAAWMCRGEARLASGQYVAAYQDCNQSIALRTAEARQFVCRGTALQYLGRAYEAASDMQAAQQLGR